MEIFQVSRKLNSQLCENYPIHKKGKKLGRTKRKSYKGSFVKYDWELILYSNPMFAQYVCPD